MGKKRERAQRKKRNKNSYHTLGKFSSELPDQIRVINGVILNAESQEITTHRNSDQNSEVLQQHLYDLP